MSSMLKTILLLSVGFECLENHSSVLSGRKWISHALPGLHRFLNYKVSIKSQIFESKSEHSPRKCRISIVDSVPENFYIDREELGDLRKDYLESEVMDIEKMTGFAKTYDYSFSFEKEVRGGSIEFEFSFPFHARYGQANQVGWVTYHLPHKFCLAHNCFRLEGKNAEFSDLKKLDRISLSVKSSLSSDFQIEEVGERSDQLKMTIPVANLNQKKFFLVSTMAIFGAGVAIVLFMITRFWRKSLELRKSD